MKFRNIWFRLFIKEYDWICRSIACALYSDIKCVKICNEKPGYVKWCTKCSIDPPLDKKHICVVHCHRDKRTFQLRLEEEK